MIYPMLRPPFEFGTFEGMTKRQAQRHFDWYIAQIPERVGLIQRLLVEVWGCQIQLDYSLCSLDLLWMEFEKHIEIVRKSEEQIRAENKDVPDYAMEELLRDNRDISQDTLTIAMDIAMYLGETLARNLPGIKWGFFSKPRRMSSVNRPVLLGFDHGLYLEPIEIVLVGCYSRLDGPNPGFLGEVVDRWRQYCVADAND